MQLIRNAILKRSLSWFAPMARSFARSSGITWSVKADWFSQSRKASGGRLNVGLKSLPALPLLMPAASFCIPCNGVVGQAVEFSRRGSKMARGPFFLISLSHVGIGLAVGWLSLQFMAR